VKKKDSGKFGLSQAMVNILQALAEGLTIEAGRDGVPHISSPRMARQAFYKQISGNSVSALVKRGLLSEASPWPVQTWKLTGKGIESALAYKSFGWKAS
jgi:hypothetical protein